MAYSIPTNPLDVLTAVVQVGITRDVILNNTFRSSGTLGMLLRRSYEGSFGSDNMPGWDLSKVRAKPGTAELAGAGVSFTAQLGNLSGSTVVGTGLETITYNPQNNQQLASAKWSVYGDPIIFTEAECGAAGFDPDSISGMSEADLKSAGEYFYEKVRNAAEQQLEDMSGDLFRADVTTQPYNSEYGMVSIFHALVGNSVATFGSASYYGVDRSTSPGSVFLGNLDATVYATTNALNTTHAQYVLSVLSNNTTTLTNNGSKKKDLFWVLPTKPFNLVGQALMGSSNVRFTEAGIPDLNGFIVNGVPVTTDYFVALDDSPLSGTGASDAGARAFCLDSAVTKCFFPSKTKTLFRVRRLTQSQATMGYFTRIVSMLQVAIQNPWRNICVSDLYRT